MNKVTASFVRDPVFFVWRKVFAEATLVRRVVLALLLAFGLVFVALVVVQYLEVRDTSLMDKYVRTAGESMVASFAQTKEHGEARIVASALSEVINADLRRQKIPAFFLVQISDLNADLIYLSREANKVRFVGDTRGIVATRINDQSYRVFRADQGTWQITLAYPIASDSFVLGRLGSDLVFYLLIAFPLVVLPIWVAVSSGLTPLKRLSQRIAEKHADDLSPLDIDAKYAELTPMVTAMNQLLAQLRAKVAREHAFVQDAAHELRTPMAVISAQAHTLVMADSKTDREDAERRMDQAIARASHLIEQLLALARMDHQHQRARQLLDVAELTRRVIADAVPSAIERHIELSLDAPESLWVMTDAQAWLSIVNNLVTNAIRYNRPHGFVEMYLSKSATMLTLIVSDNGPGIAPEHRALVFERFYREQSHGMSGSGLGLPIVKQAVSGLGGTVQLGPANDDGGCRVVVDISLA